VWLKWQSIFLESLGHLTSNLIEREREREIEILRLKLHFKYGKTQSEEVKQHSTNIFKKTSIRFKN
jgi:hypothetical protein